ncbi:MAG TPA: hypothetical protein VHR47_11520, partial [Bacillota bacterium]|nr:hypothetical protein [Bacillota bacterium]
NPATGEYDQTIKSRVPLSSVASLLYEDGNIQAAWFTRYFRGHGKIDASATSDLSFSYAFHDGFHLRAGVQNIFDREYCFNEGYPMPGINYRLEFGYNF